MLQINNERFVVPEALFSPGDIGACLGRPSLRVYQMAEGSHWGHRCLEPTSVPQGP